MTLHKRPYGVALGFSAILALTAAAPGHALAQAAAPATAKAGGEVEPGAVEALKRMSAYLGTLTAFEIKADNSLDLVLDDGQKVQVDGVATYRVRRPNGFVIEASTDLKARQFVYDGKSLTVYAPKLGYYATVDAPPTIRQALDAASQKYGVTLPLEDLFRWSEPGGAERASLLDEGFFVGGATLNGEETDQYAFRQGDIDWQIWIRRGDKPVPVKVVIVDRSDEAQPAYTARLSWNVAPSFAGDAFTFKPAKDARAISMIASR